MWKEKWFLLQPKAARCVWGGGGVRTSVRMSVNVWAVSSHWPNEIYLEIKRYFRTNHKTKINYGAVLPLCLASTRDSLQCSCRHCSSSSLALSHFSLSVARSLSLVHTKFRLSCNWAMSLHRTGNIAVCVSTFCVVGHLVCFISQHRDWDESHCEIALKHDVHTPSIR